MRVKTRLEQATDFGRVTVRSDSKESETNVGDVQMSFGRDQSKGGVVVDEKV